MTHDPLDPRAPRAWQERLRGACIGAAAWLAFVPLFALQDWMALREVGRPRAIGDAFAASLDQFLVCLPILPVLGWLVRRVPLRPPEAVRHGALLLAGVMLLAAVREYVLGPLLLPLTAEVVPPRIGSVASILANAVLYLAVVGALHARMYYREARARELEAAHLSARLAETQLEALRLQLQPHFLFNTLNAVSALIRDEPDVADRMLTRLAELLRAVLEPPAGDRHPLGAELAVLERYLEIMSLRFGERLSVQLQVPDAARAGLVPWLVLQPLVENALEHGAARRRGPVELRIAAVRATTPAGERLQLSICNRGEGGGAASGRAESGRRGLGIGLENTRRRLQQLHGDAATVTVEVHPDGSACSRVDLPWEVERAAPRAADPSIPVRAIAPLGTVAEVAR